MAETQKFKPKVLNDDEIKDLLIRVNQLCIDLKNVYYNYNDNVITDFEYDKIEQGFKIADKYNKHVNEVYYRLKEVIERDNNVSE